MQPCVVEDCVRPLRARGFCVFHYGLARKNGLPKIIGIYSAKERLSQSYEVDKDSGCWLWRLATNNSGYGCIWLPGQGKLPAHRASYMTHKGPIPTGLVIDHLCRNRRCINPAHLEAVTASENMLRAPLRKTHCKNGHALIDGNLLNDIPGSQKVRRCKTCRSAYLKEYRARKKEENAG